MNVPPLLPSRLPAAALLLLLALCSLAACDESGRAEAEEPQAPDAWPEEVTWTQVWGDEFQYEGPPDSTKWSFETGGDGWGNEEAQYYTDRRANARADGEHLVIEAQREAFENRAYTSARLNSKATWTYGRFEIRARLPEGRGTWPALWMLAREDVYGATYWPANGEIDIMEHVGYDPGVVHATVHTEAYNHTQGTQRGAQQQVAEVTTAFNVYAVEWTPDEIRAFINGEQYFTFANERRTNSKASYREWPFDQPFFLLMNIAVGGTWGGAEGLDADAFPVAMAVDYVRVYQPASLVE